MTFLLWHPTAHSCDACWSGLFDFQWMACTVDGTQAAIFTPFHCGALLMSQCTPQTVSSFVCWLCLFVVVLFRFFGSGFGPLSFLVLICLFCLLCFRPFLQWIMHMTSRQSRFLCVGLLRFFAVVLRCGSLCLCRWLCLLFWLLLTLWCLPWPLLLPAEFGLYLSSAVHITPSASGYFLSPPCCRCLRGSVGIAALLCR